MSERATRIVQIACLALLILVAFQAVRALSSEDPLADLESHLAALPAPVSPPVPVPVPVPVPPPSPSSPPSPSPSSPALPPRYQAIDAKAIFGQAPQKPVQTALLGIAGRYAILVAPDGKTGLVAEGGELGGIKLLQISVNRVLIEHQGKKQELTIFSGLGSSSLLQEGKDRSP